MITEQKRNKIIGVWLMLGVFMLLVQIFLGGVTRLTGSGLSITEWKAIMGFIPPMNVQEWTIAFEKYKQFDQFRLVNSTITLQEFKSLFFWEYIHRFWARFMGLCAFLPMIYFIIKKILLKKDILKLLLLIALGGLAGIVGWIMVMSGLEANKVLVNPFKLMFHLLIATLIIALTFRFALGYLYNKPMSNKNNATIVGFLVLVILQIGVGALVAGSKAALACNTFPLMNGSYYPNTIDFSVSYEASFNLLIQFIHRNIAFVIILYFIYLWIKTKHIDYRKFKLERTILALLIILQITLGIITVMSSKGNIPIFFAEIHQLGAYGVLLSTIALQYFYKIKL
ncbi:MAG: COX15/CtaA family protein [Chitinophagales bacterium]|nr:COX15/CtaA family protein [Chitinophagales bacterium]